MTPSPPQVFRILIIGDAVSFPFGTGAASRMLGLARALQAAGAAVQVLVTHPSESQADSLNTEPRGIHLGIPFEYATGTTVRPASFWHRRWIHLKSLIRQLQWVATGEPFDAVIVMTMESWVLPLVIGQFARRRGAALLYEGCELPFAHKPQTWRNRLVAWAYARWVFRRYDGIFVISDYLARWFGQRVGPATRLIHVPILVDLEQFSSSAQGANGHAYIAYSGSLDPCKGVEHLLRAYALLSGRHQAVELWVAGSTDDADGRRLVELSRTLGIASRVRFMGLVPHTDLPQLLAQAKVLVVPHCANDRTQAAFPTKLGEYLATGRPVIATQVGELDRYLTDAVNAYLVPPDDPEALAARLGQVLEHPEQAGEVGRRGFETARQQFEHRAQGARLLEEIRAIRAARIRR